MRNEEVDNCINNPEERAVSLWGGGGLASTRRQRRRYGSDGARASTAAIASRENTFALMSISPPPSHFTTRRKGPANRDGRTVTRAARIVLRGTCDDRTRLRKYNVSSVMTIRNRAIQTKQRTPAAATIAKIWRAPGSRHRNDNAIMKGANNTLKTTYVEIAAR